MTLDRSLVGWETSNVSLSAWILLGWFALAADVVYWCWELGQPEDQQLSTWHADLNIVLYFGAGALFVVLLIVSLLAWRANESARDPR